LRIATSACSTAAADASSDSVRWPSWKVSARMPAMPSNARRISDSSTAQSMLGTRIRVQPLASAAAAALCVSAESCACETP
jgi:hypothetical protein